MKYFLFPSSPYYGEHTILEMDSLKFRAVSTSEIQSLTIKWPNFSISMDEDCNIYNICNIQIVKSLSSISSFFLVSKDRLEILDGTFQMFGYNDWSSASSERTLLWWAKKTCLCFWSECCFSAIALRSKPIQILTCPSILFCDEPTSGLDAFMAGIWLRVINNSRIHRARRAIIAISCRRWNDCRHHHPSTE